MKMLEDLAEVVRMIDGARPGTYTSTSHNYASFLVTHHATIRDMAARLEAAERDAARWRYVYTERMVMRDLGGIYHGDVDYPTAEEIDAAMQETGR